MHTHNLATALTAVTQCRYTPAAAAPTAPDTRTFLGYRRSDGRVGTRNELWVLCSVGCVAHTARRIAETGFERLRDRVDGVHALTHPFGCSQLGDDLAHTRQILAALAAHPNAGGAPILTEIPELFGAEHLLMARAADEAVSGTALAAAGATVLLFTTGRGTPFGFPTPTLKISTTSALAQAKPRWIDFDAGRLLKGARMDELAHELLALVIETASGRASCAERNGEREIAIWKTGVTL